MRFLILDKTLDIYDLLNKKKIKFMISFSVITANINVDKDCKNVQIFVKSIQFL